MHNFKDYIKKENKKKLIYTVDLSNFSEEESEDNEGLEYYGLIIIKDITSNKIYKINMNGYGDRSGYSPPDAIGNTIIKILKINLFREEDKADLITDRIGHGIENLRIKNINNVKYNIFEKYPLNYENFYEWIEDITIIVL